jgi:nucleotide-binding universal stress UspA family protein
MFKNILVATDGSPLGRSAVETTANLANKFEATVNLVTIVGQGDVPESMVRMLKAEHLVEGKRSDEATLGILSRAPGPAVRADSRAAEAAEVHFKMAELILGDAKEQLKEAGLKNFDSHMENGKPADVILELAKQSKSDLIVIGSRGFGDLKSLILGSVSHKVLQMAECPCLIVK